MYSNIKPKSGGSGGIVAIKPRLAPHNTAHSSNLSPAKAPHLIIQDSRVSSNLTVQTTATSSATISTYSPQLASGSSSSSSTSSSLSKDDQVKPTSTSPSANYAHKCKKDDKKVRGRPRIYAVDPLTGKSKKGKLMTNATPNTAPPSQTLDTAPNTITPHQVVIPTLSSSVLMPDNVGAVRVVFASGGAQTTERRHSTENSIAVQENTAEALSNSRVDELSRDEYEDEEEQEVVPQNDGVDLDEILAAGYKLVH